MMSALHRAFVFASTAFLVLLLADLTVWRVYQGMHPRDELQTQLLMHGAMHASVLVLSIIGAAVAYFLLRRRLPSTKAASLFGVIFAGLSFFAIVTVFTTAGFLGAGAWLLLGSVTVALSSALIVGRHDG